MDYFESYTDIHVHRVMLEDVQRNAVYKKAIDDNKSSFEGKIVMDVGAGTGILSIFCAKAGAAKVYAVEASDIHEICKETVKENGFQHIIEVIHGDVEHISLPEHGKVDIIISEWMGHYLLHEGMLDSVIKARDKFLKPNGLMFPETATLYCAPSSVPSYFAFWDNVNGVSLKYFSKTLRNETAHKPTIMPVSAGDILADSEALMWIDLREVTVDEVNCIKVQHFAVVNKSGNYQGVCLWFTCTFPSSVTEPVVLSTEPGEPKTHWMQTVIIFPVSIPVELGAPIAYELSVSRSEQSHRKYNMELTVLDPEEIPHPEYCGCHMTKCILARAVLEQYEQSNVLQH